MKLNPQYFWPGKHHLCMFCNVPIGNLSPTGGIRPSSNKAHVLFEKTEPGLYIINCCSDCAVRVNFKDPLVIKAIRFNHVKSQEFLDELKGVLSSNLSMRRKRLSDVPKIDGFCEIELLTKDRTKNVNKYKESLNGR